MEGTGVVPSVVELWVVDIREVEREVVVAETK